MCDMIAVGAFSFLCLAGAWAMFWLGMMCERSTRRNTRRHKPGRR